MQEEYKITIINNKHIFEVLDTKSQTLVFTEILRMSEDHVYNNTIKNRNILLKRLRKIDKKISQSRFFAILGEIVTKRMLEWKSKGVYKINQEYIEKL